MMTPAMETQIVDVEKIAAATDLPNFSEPGTGKTLTAIYAIEKMGLQGGVILGPQISTVMWQRTLSYELGAKVQLVKSGKEKLDPLADFYVLSYGIAAAQKEALLELPTGVLVLDESQYLRTSEAARTMAVFGEECDGEGGLYENSEQCWCLSGEPVERHADDLWSQLRACQPEVLDKYNALSLKQFQQQFCRMEYRQYNARARGSYVSVGSSNEKLLNRMLYNPEHGIGAIRRTMAEVEPYMPEVRFSNVFTKAVVSPELRSLLVGKTPKEIEELVTQGAESRARRLTGMAKTVEVVNYISGVAHRQTVLVGFWHTDVGIQLESKLLGQGLRVSTISGSTSPAARERIRLAFINGEIDVLLGQIQAMGISMDGLQTVCNRVIFAELDWSWARMFQFLKRIARKGQKHKTQVDFCTSMDAVDSALESVAARKRASGDEINAAVK